MPDSRFLTELGKRVLLGSGAMGTELLRRGSLPNRPVDELNLTRPHLVLDLMREYASAGAEVIKTNTFLANRIRLQDVGLQDRVRDINLAGAQLARDAAKGRFVAGCVGPTQSPTWDVEPYREQCAALAEGGCDLLLFETFTHSEDLQTALKAGWTTRLPVVCETSQANFMIARLTQLPQVDVIGVNCVDPQVALSLTRELKEHTNRFLSAFPSAGLPGQEKPPEEFADWMKKIVDSGARFVGGCCGAGPDHIRAAAGVVGRGR